MAQLHSGRGVFTAGARPQARCFFSGPRRASYVVAAHERPVFSQASLIDTAAPVSSVKTFKGDLMNPTYYPTSADASNLTKSWYIVDAEGQTLGRLASLVAMYIRGKAQSTYTPSMDMGAYVIVINAEKVTVSGTKFDDKTYFNHVNGRPGSYRVEAFKDLQKRLPERVIERAVQGMLPKGRLGRDIRLHLKAYPGPNHPHEAQQPKNITAAISQNPSKGSGAALLASMKATA